MKVPKKLSNGKEAEMSQRAKAALEKFEEVSESIEALSEDYETLKTAQKQLNAKQQVQNELIERVGNSISERIEQNVMKKLASVEKQVLDKIWNFLVAKPVFETKIFIGSSDSVEVQEALKGGWHFVSTFYDNKKGKLAHVAQRTILPKTKKEFLATYSAFFEEEGKPDIAGELPAVIDGEPKSEEKKKKRVVKKKAK